MAKIILNDVTNVKVHGINPVVEGTKLFFVSELNKGNFVATYQRDDESKSGVGLCAVALFGGVLRPVILQYRSVWGVSVTPVEIGEGETTRVPQMKHTASQKLCTLGSEALKEIAKGRKVLQVNKIYSGVFRKKKDLTPYTWDLLGIDETGETFTVDNGKVTFENVHTDVATLQTLFNELQERESERVATL